MKIREDNELNIQEASQGIARGRNSIPSPKRSYMEENTQKTKKQMITHDKLHSCAPGCDPCSPKHAK